IVQNYRIRSRDGKEAAPTRAYQKWFDELLSVKTDLLIPSLGDANLLMDNDTYENAQAPLSEFLIEVPDFNSLIAISQSLSKPVFELTRDDIMNSGSVAKNQVESAEKFHQIYTEAAGKILSMI
ncbi:hypothetical protein, partial [Novosphingobium sp.]|uniref:hypothetical protein n=1 Tax=Novosphingobium sp. TaxID=1874826 RepID=UPI0028A7A8B3